MENNNNTRNQPLKKAAKEKQQEFLKKNTAKWKKNKKTRRRRRTRRSRRRREEKSWGNEKPCCQKTSLSSTTRKGWTSAQNPGRERDRLIHYLSRGNLYRSRLPSLFCLSADASGQMGVGKLGFWWGRIRRLMEYTAVHRRRAGDRRGRRIREQTAS